jgi:hypothetical protein
MEPVFAYIDIGTGSLVVQAAIAALVAAPFVLRTQIAGLIARVRGKGSASTATATADAAASDPQPAATVPAAGPDAAG